MSAILQATPLVMGEMQLDTAFHYHFASHLMGMAKPDVEAYQYVTNSLDVDMGLNIYIDPFFVLCCDCKHKWHLVLLVLIQIVDGEISSKD